MIYPYSTIEEVSDEVEQMVASGSTINNTLTTFASDISHTAKALTQSSMGDDDLILMNKVTPLDIK